MESIDVEKQPLLHNTSEDLVNNDSTKSQDTQSSKSVKTTGIRLFDSILFSVILFYLYWHFSMVLSSANNTVELDGLCNQFEAKSPSENKQLEQNKELIFSPEYRLKSVKILSGLVQVHSESFDDLGEVGEDSRWDVFYDLADYLKITFPLVHEKLILTRVNTHGFVFTWNGSNSDLKPSLLMAHSDTVPVNPSTISDWTYEPWSGEYDGKYLWGRGASDCKNTLTGILEAVTLLLQKGFEPKRTIILAFGFDEESKGYNGAGSIATYLEATYGKDGIAFILDEGGLGIGEMYGTAFALPSTGEKGYLDVNFTLNTPGGHSSIPPNHTGIGMLSTIITKLESNPYTPSISLTSPIYSLLQCAAKYGDLAPSLKSAVIEGSQSKNSKSGIKARQIVADEFSKLGRNQQYLVSTSQAVDVIGGGVKVNALPELSFAVVNYRISVDSSSDVVREKIKSLIKPIVQQYALDLNIFGIEEKFTPSTSTCSHSKAQDETFVSGGKLTVTAINALEPAPISSTNTLEWKLLASTIQHVYAEKFKDVENGLIVSPCVMTGNTDTRFYWNLSKNIYRFTPMDRAGSFGIHTIDEHLLFDDHISGIFFFHELLRNADEAEFK